MKLQSTKYIKDIPVGEQLVGADFTTIDGVVKGLELKFGNGKFIRCSVENYTDFRVCIPAKPKMIDAWLVTGTLEGTDVSIQIHLDCKFKAEQLKGNLIKSTIASVQVPEDFDFNSKTVTNTDKNITGEVNVY